MPEVEKQVNRLRNALRRAWHLFRHFVGKERPRWRADLGDRPGGETPIEEIAHEVLAAGPPAIFQFSRTGVPVVRSREPLGRTLRDVLRRSVGALSSPVVSLDKRLTGQDSEPTTLGDVIESDAGAGGARRADDRDDPADAIEAVDAKAAALAAYHVLAVECRATGGPAAAAALAWWVGGTLRQVAEDHHVTPKAVRCAKKWVWPKADRLRRRFA